MNSLKKGLLRLCGYVIEQKLPPPPEQPTVGVLFGLDPPKGHYFRVFYSQLPPNAWFVELRETDGDAIVAHELELTSWFSGDRIDERCIKAAAKKALAKYDASQHRKDLQGRYPPKRTA